MPPPQSIWLSTPTSISMARILPLRCSTMMSASRRKPFSASSPLPYTSSSSAYPSCSDVYFAFADTFCAAVLHLLHCCTSSVSAANRADAAATPAFMLAGSSIQTADVKCVGEWVRWASPGFGLLSPGRGGGEKGARKVFVWVEAVCMG